MKKSHMLALAAAGFSGFGLSVLVAFEQGADIGRSGGPAGYFGEAGNCTACHAFNSGPGGVQILGAPRRYQSDRIYDLTVRVFDPQQEGAGFEISAEGNGGHIGVFELTDETHTKNANNRDPIHYVTQTRDGFDDSVANWLANGGSYEFHTAWRAPAVDSGRVTFFAAGNAVDHANGFAGDRYYATFLRSHFAVPGDGDGDTDIDLLDFADVQRCFSGNASTTGEGCEFVDFDSDNIVSLSDAQEFAEAVSGPTTSLPVEYIMADAVRGGQLYDNWAVASGVPAPQTDHPLWAFRPDPISNPRSGPATWRCKECHGWDYKGVDGQYGDIASGHRTGFGGVFGTTLGPQQLFDLLKADDPNTGGHNMDSGGLTDGDLWDVVKMILEGVLDTNAYIHGDATFNGDPDFGYQDYYSVCISCHGPSGTEVPGVDIKSVAATNPWEFLHKARFGQPGAPMPAIELLEWGAQSAADIGAYAAFLAP